MIQYIPKVQYSYQRCLNSWKLFVICVKFITDSQQYRIETVTNLLVLLGQGRHAVSVDVGAAAGPQPVLVQVEYGATVHHGVAVHLYVPEVVRVGAELAAKPGQRVRPYHTGTAAWQVVTRYRLCPFRLGDLWGNSKLDDGSTDFFNSNFIAR